MSDDDKKQVTGKEDKASKFLRLISKVIEILENIPKALAGILLIVSLFGGATGVYSVMKPEEKAEENSGELAALEIRVYTLEVEKKILNELLIKLLGAHGLLDEDIELEAFIVEMPKGKVVPKTE